MLYKHIKRLCAHRGLTITALAELSGVSTKTMARWDRAKPTDACLEAVAEVLHVSVESLEERIALQPTVRKTCELCGQEYEANRIGAHKSKYCSDECKAEAEKARSMKWYQANRPQGVATVKCHMCGQEFEVKASAVSNFKYCSDECREEAHKRYYYNHNKPGPGLTRVARHDVKPRKPKMSSMAKFEDAAREQHTTYGKLRARQFLAAQKERERLANEKEKD